jgi:hypothetical protein
MSLKIKSGGINYNVPTVNDFPTDYLEEGLICVVTDENQGGTFVYREDNALVNNGGTIFDGWTRQYSGAVNVKWFGAVGDGITDDTATIQEALTLVSEDGGSLLFSEGTYVLSTLNLVNNSIFYVKDKGGFSIIGSGATLHTTITNGGSSLFLLDGCRNIIIDGLRLSGGFQRSLSVVNTSAPFSILLLSTDRDSNNVNISNIYIENMHSFLIIQGSIGQNYQVKNINISNIFAFNGYYGINCVNNGHNLVCNNLNTVRYIRSYFPYGVYNHTVQYLSSGGDVFSDCLIKSYGQDTHSINVNATIVDNTSAGAKFTIESQHEVGGNVGKIYDIQLTINDTDGCTGGSGRFAYYVGSTSVDTSSDQLFNNITIKGKVREDFDYAVTPAVGYINFSELEYPDTKKAYTYKLMQKIHQGFAQNINGDTQFNNGKSFAINGSLAMYDFVGTYKGGFVGSAGVNSFKLQTPAAYPFLFESTNTTTGALIATITDSSGIGAGVSVYTGGNSIAPNVANAVLKVGNMGVTGRSINAAGTINASGADYAEYEFNNGVTFSKGDIVGFKSDGTLTDKFSESLRFGIKSTNPSYVGGDTWTSHLVEPVPVERITTLDGTSFEESEEDFNVRKDSYDKDLQEFNQEVEKARVLVDRIAYSGKVPVNIYDATEGQYITPISGSNDTISYELVDEVDMSLAKYLKVIGKVNKILPDSRCEVVVVVH